MKSNLNFMNKFKSELSENVKLANYSWFNLGGNANRSVLAGIYGNSR